MTIKQNLKVWGLSGTLSAITFSMELYSNYISASSWFRTFILILLVLSTLLSFKKFFLSYKHYISMKIVGFSIKKKALEYSNSYIFQEMINLESLNRALQLDSTTYEPNYSWSLQRWSEFYAKNRHIAFGLFYSNDLLQMNCLGGISLFPISIDTYNALRRNEISEMDITANNLLNEDEMYSGRYWLIPGLVIFNWKAGNIKSSFILVSLINHILLKCTFPITFITLGYSNEGRSVLNKFGFINCNNLHIDGFYSNTYSSKTELIERLPKIFKQ